MNRLFCLILLLLSMLTPSFSQVTEVAGYIHERDTSLPVSNAIVTICNQKNNILCSGLSTKDGKFRLSTKGENLSVCTLKVSCMGYKPTSCQIGNKKTFRIELNPKAFVLKDVYVMAKKITHHNDTTSYLVSGFSTPKDRTIGDVLKKMPGIEVSKSGNVSYNGRAISEFLIEGADLFDGQYNIATRNISHDLISRVDVIENYQSAKILKGSKKEGETVLNLSLKDNAKGRWSGNIKAGGGIPNLWEEEIFSARLSSTNQTSITLKTNNSGKDILSENKVLTLDDYLNQYVLDEAKPILDISQEMPGMLDGKRTRNAKTHIFNIGNVQKVSDTSILHSKIYYTDDRNISDSESGISYFLADSTMTKRTTEYSTLGTKELAASLLFKNDKSTSFFSNELKYSSLWQCNKTRMSGDYSNFSKIQSDVHILSNKLKWIMPVGKHFVTIESKNMFQTMPEIMNVESSDGQSIQEVRRNQFLSLSKVDYIWNLKRWALSVDAKGIVSVSKVKSDFTSEYMDTVFHENSNRNFLALVLRPNLTYKYKGVRYEMELPLSVYHYWGMGTPGRVFCAPKLTFGWQMNTHWKFRTNLTLGSSPKSVNNSYDAPVMTNNRTFRSSPVVNYGQKKCSWAFAVNYADYTHMFFGNASIGLNWGKDRASTTKWVNHDYVYYSLMKGESKSKGTMILGNISKRIKGIKGTLNAKCFYFLNHATMYQNGISVDFKTSQLQTSVGLNSNVQNWIEVDYRLGYNVNTLDFSIINSSSKSLTQELQISILPIECLTLTIAAEHYATFFSSLATKHTIFSDVRCSYRYRKIDVIGSVTNIFNNRYYSNTTYSDLSSSYNKYTLRGRNLLIGVVVYF